MSIKVRQFRAEGGLVTFMIADVTEDTLEVLEVTGFVPFPGRGRTRLELSWKVCAPAPFDDIYNVGIGVERKP